MDATVLILDEDVNTQIVAQTLLDLRGLRVRLAGDGAAACDLVRDENVAVVVLDLNLSGMSSFELLRRLRGPRAPRYSCGHQQPRARGRALRIPHGRGCSPSQAACAGAVHRHGGEVGG